MSIFQTTQELYRYIESIYILCSIFSIFLILCRPHAPLIYKIYVHPGRFRSEFDPIATRRRWWGKDTDGSLKKWFSQRLHRVGWPKFGSSKQSWVKKCLVNWVNCLGKWMDILFKGEVEMLRVASCSVLSDRKGWRRCDFVSTLVPSSNPSTWIHWTFHDTTSLVLTMRFYRRPPHACHSSLCSFLFIIMAYSLFLHGSVRTSATEQHEGLESTLSKKNIWKKRSLPENVAQYRPASLQCSIECKFAGQISNDLHLILMLKRTLVFCSYSTFSHSHSETFFLVTSIVLSCIRQDVFLFYSRTSSWNNLQW